MKALRFAWRSLVRQPARATLGVMGVAAVGALLFDMLMLSDGLIVSMRDLLERTGFDIRITDRFSIRPIKFDYLPTWTRTPILIFTPPTLPLTPTSRFTLAFAGDDVDNDKKVRNNFRIGAGVVFSF